jgi:hypothetical protein
MTASPGPALPATAAAVQLLALLTLTLSRLHPLQLYILFTEVLYIPAFKELLSGAHLTRSRERESMLTEGAYGKKGSLSHEPGEARVMGFSPPVLVSEKAPFSVG